MGKFRIKISPWWPCDNWVEFKYSTNGVIWRRIYKCKGYITDGRHYMEPLSTLYSDAESTIAKFKSIEDIRKYEQQEKQKMIKLNADLDAQNKRIEAEKKALYKKYS